jgi:hypothetical protein
MFVPSLKENISVRLATQIVFSADAIWRDYALGNLKSIDEAYEAIRYASRPI